MTSPDPATTVPPPQAAGVAPQPIKLSTEVEQALYEVRKKISPRAEHGWFAAWRWTLVWFTQILFYGTAWLTWNDRQAVLFDLA
jgi:hypothetical protein